jgi:hypothetical protein
MKKKRLLSASRDPDFEQWKVLESYRTMPVTEEEEEAWQYLEKHQPKEEHNESERRHSKH